jgi:hypothetical protein
MSQDFILFCSLLNIFILQTGLGMRTSYDYCIHGLNMIKSPHEQLQYFNYKRNLKRFYTWDLTSVGHISQKFGYHTRYYNRYLSDITICDFFLVNVRNLCISFFRHSYFTLNPKPSHLFTKHFVYLNFSTFSFVEHSVKNGRSQWQ